jgi:hypothetical protein
MTRRRIVILGGYGTFGRLIAEQLHCRRVLLAVT